MFYRLSKKLVYGFFVLLFFLFSISGGVIFSLQYYIKHPGISTLQEYQALSTAFTLCSNGAILNEPSWKGMAINLIDIHSGDVIYNYFEWRRGIRNAYMNKTDPYSNQVIVRSKKFLQLFINPEKYRNSQELLKTLKQYNVSCILLTRSNKVLIRKNVGVKIMKKRLRNGIFDNDYFKLIYEMGDVRIYKVLYTNSPTSTTLLSEESTG